MATHLFHRSLPKTLILGSLFSRSFLTATGAAAVSASSHSSSLLRRLRPLAALVAADFRRLSLAPGPREFSTRATSSSLNDPNPNWSNRPPKETILLDGCDFEHWLVVMEKPEGDPTRDEIIDSYIKTLAMVVGSEEEARMKIYSVSTRCYYAFGCLVSEELSYKIKELPKVRWVLPDSYLDVKNKDYGGEPFIDGQAVPYDPKYHEEWIRNNARANERNRRNDRPRNFDRSRNFERRRENMQGNPPTGPNMGGGPPGGGAPSGGPPGNMPPSNFGPPPPQNQGGMPSSNYAQPPPSNWGGPPPPPPNTYRGGPPPPPNNFEGAPPPRNFAGGAPPPPPMNNFDGPPSPRNYGGAPPPPPNNFEGPPPPHNYGGVPPPPPHNFEGPPPPRNYGGALPPPPSNNFGPPPPRDFGGPQPGNYGGPQSNNYWGAPPPPQSNNYGGPSNGAGSPQQNSHGGAMQSRGWSSNVHNNQQE